MLRGGTPFTWAVLAVLAGFSVLSLAIVFSKRSAFGAANRSDGRFIRAFRKSNSFETVVAAAENFRPTPLVKIFDAGNVEVERQLKAYRQVTNKEAISRCLQIAISEQLSRFENNLNWLATIASVSPFIGLFGTSLTSVGPGISEALIATAVGLLAAIPAAIFYNHFGRQLKEMGDRFDNFALEFANMVERLGGE